MLRIDRRGPDRRRTGPGRAEARIRASPDLREVARDRLALDPIEMPQRHGDVAGMSRQSPGPDLADRPRAPGQAGCGQPAAQRGWQRIERTHRLRLGAAAQAGPEIAPSHGQQPQSLPSSGSAASRTNSRRTVPVPLIGGERWRRPVSSPRHSVPRRTATSPGARRRRMRASLSGSGSPRSLPGPRRVQSSRASTRST